MPLILLLLLLSYNCCLVIPVMGMENQFPRQEKSPSINQLPIIENTAKKSKKTNTEDYSTIHCPICQDDLTVTHKKLSQLKRNFKIHTLTDLARNSHHITETIEECLKTANQGYICILCQKNLKITAGSRSKPNALKNHLLTSHFMHTACREYDSHKLNFDTHFNNPTAHIIKQPVIHQKICLQCTDTNKDNCKHAQ